VLGDFSGNPAEPLPRLKDRKFAEITPDNFDETLASMKPRGSPSGARPSLSRIKTSV
jgi:type VI secretion system protein ImpB